MTDLIGLLSEFIKHSDYFNNLTTKEQDDKFSLIVKWLGNGNLDDELLKTYLITRVFLDYPSPISNLLEFSLQLGCLLDHDLIKLMKSVKGLYYDGFFGEYRVKNS